MLAFALACFLLELVVFLLAFWNKITFSFFLVSCVYEARKPIWGFLCNLQKHFLILLVMKNIFVSLFLPDLLHNISENMWLSVEFYNFPISFYRGQWPVHVGIDIWNHRCRYHLCGSQCMVWFCSLDDYEVCFGVLLFHEQIGTMLINKLKIIIPFSRSGNFF